MVTIHNLEVRFEVEGTGDEAAFSRLYYRQSRRERELLEERKCERAKLDRERALGDREGEEHGP
jgi:hypothetical protein